MVAGQERELTPKARRARETILESALGLFTEKGQEATTMRDVAKEAGASLGLAYRYYASKEELVLYLRLADEFAEEAMSLPAGTVAERFKEAMLLKLGQVEPYRRPLGALLAKALDPNSPVATLGEGTSIVRERVGKAFLKVVRGAKDAPGDAQARELVAFLNALHLALLLHWFHDKSPDGGPRESSCAPSARLCASCARPSSSRRCPACSRGSRRPWAR